ncbi:hypothetical protein MKW92_010456 [Papaver armeniacum]|nr:hypothetical protein MKW92_010456 [Papaver armeniacum]
MLTNVHESCEALRQFSKKELVRVKMEATVRRSVALILMKHNDYVRARKKLVEARTFDAGLEYIDELIKVCDMVCAVKSQGSGISWCSVLGINKTAIESEIEVKYTELIRTLEPIKNKFLEIQSALGLIEKAYSELSDREECHGFDWERAASLGPCGSVKPLDVTHSETVNINSEATSQSSSGNKRIVSEGSEKSSLICSLWEQPCKRVRTLGGDDCEVKAETKSLDKLIGKVRSQEAGSDTAESKSSLNEVPNPDPLSTPEDAVMDIVPAEFDIGASIKQKYSTSPAITSVLNPGICRQCAGDVASGDQNVKKLNSTTLLKLLSPRTCEEKKSQADGKSKDGITSSNNLEMDGLLRENVGNLTAENGKEKVAEEIDFKSDGVILGGCMVNVSEYGNNASDPDDAVNKLADKEKVSGEIDTGGDCVRLGGDDCELIAETQEMSSDTAKHGTRSNKVEGSLGRLSESVVNSIVYKEPTLEFHDFSNNKKAAAFAVDQFLAVYDQEKMPRLYAKITRIERCYKKETNSTDNVLYVRWLRPAPINPDERKWHEAGLPVSCGFFKIDGVGKCNILAISHLVSSFREYHYSNNLFELYPREGEVWALYKEWKPFHWCSDPKTRKGCKFLLVEILSDYSTAAGVKVASLVKVAGYRSIFRRSDLSYQIPSRNLFGFSHNVPVRSAGDMKGLFSGTVLDLDPLSIPEDVSVDTVAAKFSNGSSSIMHQNSGFSAITSMRNTVKTKREEETDIMANVVS